MFQGASSLSLDAKGRLSVPTRHRDVLSATAAGQLTITIDAAYVDARLQTLSQDEDLSRYIL